MGAVGGEELIMEETSGCEERILVSVRLRPLNEKEISRNDVSEWECINDNTVICRNALSVAERSLYPSAYTFDRVFGCDCSTRKVYEEGAKEVALSVVSGVNSTIFAYGQTSSGKTYTMSGITEYTMADIYDYIEKHTEREFLLKFSAIEIYNESVRDLLSIDNSPLRLLDDPERGTTVEKLIEETLRDRNHFRQLLSLCEAQRQIGETSLNEASSRSHQILRLTIESSAREFLGKDKSSSLTATVNFVDLAGSERASQSLSAGARLKEGCHINRSLLTLGTVIRKLSKGRNGHIPFRDSKLTRILQSSLGGNARTAIICTMSPAQIHVEQSRNTLFFASCAKEVVTNAQVNVVVSDKALVKQLQRELARLESELKSSVQTSGTPDFALIREKDLQIEKLKKDLRELTLERDYAKSQVKDLLRMVEEDKPLIPSTNLDEQYPRLRVRSLWDFENRPSQTKVMKDSRTVPSGTTVITDSRIIPFETSVMPDPRIIPSETTVMTDSQIIPFETTVMPNSRIIPSETTVMTDSRIIHSETTIMTDSRIIPSKTTVMTDSRIIGDVSRSFDASRYSGGHNIKSDDNFVHLVKVKKDFLQGKSPPRVSSMVPSWADTQQHMEDVEELSCENSEDICKEVRCIEMEESSMNRYLVSTLSGSSPERYVNSTTPSPIANTATSKVVDNGQSKKCKLESSPAIEDSKSNNFSPFYVIVSPEKPSPWNMEKEICSSGRLTLTRSRSCKASILRTLSSENIKEFQSTPPIWVGKDFAGRHEGFQMKLAALKYDVESGRSSPTCSQTSQKSVSKDVHSEQNFDAVEDDKSDVTTSATELELQISNFERENQLLDATKLISNLSENHLLDATVLEAKPKLTESEKNAEDVGMDPMHNNDMKSPSKWPSEFKSLQKDIIGLWHFCNVSLVHRTYFFLLFKGGDPADSIYMEVEFRRLSFLKRAFSQGTPIVENGQTLTPTSSLKVLGRERQMLCRQMQKRLSKKQRDTLFVEWGIGLNSNNRRLQLAHLVWNDTQDMDHIRKSAAIVAKLVNYVEPDQASKEMFGLNFTPRHRDARGIASLETKHEGCLVM